MHRRLTLLFVLALMTLASFSQETYKPESRVDHLAIVVDDLAKSAAFYQEILGLKEITNQTQNPDIRWFAFGAGIELHLINRSKEGIQVKKDLHLALAINDLKAFMKMLDENGIYYESWPGKAGTSNSRPDGVNQIYLQDPDGYWIEINDADRF